MTGRRLVGVCALVLGLLVGGALPSLASVPTAVGPPCLDASDVGPVQIVTIPEVPGLVVSFDGQPVTLSDRGTATVTGCREELVSRLSVDPDPVPLGEGRQVRYDRVFVQDSGRLATLAFYVDYLTELSLNGLPAEDVESVTIRSSTGARLTTTEQAPQWLWSQRVVRGPSGFLLRDIFYTVDSVMVNDENVVVRSLTKFYPRESQVVQVPLLTFRVDLRVRDRLFGFPIGSTAYLEAPNGEVFEVPLEAGAATLTSLPRGTYTLSVDAPGLDTPRPLSVSRDQEVDLPVLSYLDLSVLLGLPALAGLALIVLPRPRLRRAVMSRLPVPVRLVRRFRQPANQEPAPEPEAGGGAELDADVEARASHAPGRPAALAAFLWRLWTTRGARTPPPALPAAGAERNKSPFPPRV